MLARDATAAFHVRAAQCSHHTDILPENLTNRHHRHELVALKLEIAHSVGDDCGQRLGHLRALGENHVGEDRGDTQTMKGGEKSTKRARTRMISRRRARVRSERQQVEHRRHRMESTTRRSRQSKTHITKQKQPSDQPNYGSMGWVRRSVLPGYMSLPESLTQPRRIQERGDWRTTAVSQHPAATDVMYLFA